MIKGAIFDVDGTILDSMPMWDNIGRIYLNDKGIKAETDLSRTMFSMTMEEGAVYLKKRYRLHLTPDEISAEIKNMTQAFYQYEVPLKANVFDFLSSLNRRGITITAATLSERNIVEAAFSRLNISRLFSGIFTAAEVGAGKDRPDIFYAAQSHMGTDISQTWVFEDGLYAMKTAKAAGFRVCGVFDRSSIADREKIQAACDVYLPSYAKVYVSRFEGDYEI